jgi:hypothetical protein
MKIQRPNCMKTLRQGSVSISLSRLSQRLPDSAPILADAPNKNELRVTNWFSH